MKDAVYAFGILFATLFAGLIGSQLYSLGFIFYVVEITGFLIGASILWSEQDKAYELYMALCCFTAAGMFIGAHYNIPSILTQ